MSPSLLIALTDEETSRYDATGEKIPRSKSCWPHFLRILPPRCFIFDIPRASNGSLACGDGLNGVKRIRSHVHSSRSLRLRVSPFLRPFFTHLRVA